MKRTWNANLTIVDTAKKKSLIHNECYSKRSMELFIRNNLSGFDCPNVKIKNVVVEEIFDDRI